MASQVTENIHLAAEIRVPEGFQVDCVFPAVEGFDVLKLGLHAKAAPMFEIILKWQLKEYLEIVVVDPKLVPGDYKTRVSGLAKQYLPEALEGQDGRDVELPGRRDLSVRVRALDKAGEVLGDVGRRFEPRLDLLVSAPRFPGGSGPAESSESRRGYYRSAFGPSAGKTSSGTPS